MFRGRLLGRTELVPLTSRVRGLIYETEQVLFYNEPSGLLVSLARRRLVLLFVFLKHVTQFGDALPFRCTCANDFDVLALA